MRHQRQVAVSSALPLTLCNAQNTTLEIAVGWRVFLVVRGEVPFRANTVSMRNNDETNNMWRPNVMWRRRRCCLSSVRLDKPEAKYHSWPVERRECYMSRPWKFNSTEKGTLGWMYFWEWICLGGGGGELSLAGTHHHHHRNVEFDQNSLSVGEVTSRNERRFSAAHWHVISRRC